MNWIELHEHREVQNFLLAWENEDPNDAILKGHYPKEWNRHYLFAQLDGHKRFKRKFPAWLDQDLILPPKKALEQCSSFLTARYKADLIKPGKRMLDLSAGFGGDALNIAPKFEEAIFVEKDPLLAEVLNYNANKLGLRHVKVFNGTAEEALKEIEGNFDFILVDPDRRPGGQGRVVRFSDSEPRLDQLIEILRARADRVLVKSSPMIDLRMGEQELGEADAIRVISIGPECKEVLFDFGVKEKGKLRTSWWNNSSWLDFNFKPEEESNQVIEFGDLEECLFDPNPGILKAKGFKSLSSHFNIRKLAQDTHLYSSSLDKPEFPGRRYKVLRSGEMGDFPKEMKEQSYRIFLRNSMIDLKEIKKKLSIQEGEEQGLFVFRDQSGKHRWSVVEEVLGK